MEISSIPVPVQGQRQGQVMSPAQRQSLKFLQMTLCELRIEIQKELEENPLLDWPEEAGSGEGPEPAEPGPDHDDEENGEEKEEFPLTIRETSFDGTMPDHPAQRESCPEAFLAQKETFRDLLLEQLSGIRADPKLLSVCRDLIDCLDERGYLGCDLRDISEAFNLPLPFVERALGVVQTLQPCGVGARDLKECLLLQIKNRQDFNKNLLRIVNCFLGKIADNDIKGLARALKVDLNTAVHYCDIIKSLQPIPSQGYDTEATAEYIVPEALIGRDRDGFLIRLNRGFLPRLRISRDYERMLGSARDPETRRFLREKKSKAAALIKEVDMRNETILKILRKIVELQNDYFRHGALKPMKISDVSGALHLHESTVSRAIRNKYIACCFGTVSLKSLFTASVPTDRPSHAVSSAFVKDRIRRLIAGEDPFQPLSDSGIREKLKESGILVSRRTVAKYREELRIGSSGRRKAFGGRSGPAGDGMRPPPR